MRVKNGIFVLAMSSVLLLTGCGGGSNGDSQANAAQGNNVQQQGNVQGQDQGQSQGRSPMMGADLLGKVKSISGQTVTVYKSSFTPGARGQGGGQRPEGQTGSGDRSNANEGDQPPASGDSNGGNAGGDPGAAPSGQNRPNMANMFSDETVDIQVTDATKIVKTTFENNERKETALALADLKEGDIVSVDLEDGSQNAVTITLGQGGFGGAGRRNGNNAQQDQQQSQ
ncbi:hypothetical protein ACFPPD_22115 [Cohnella suwonensis]|uniref:DUF5666 domain-containing protein n=1 Tax=Cohnella suwonensis TaxID=696072 RepID=A0ABW0LZT2_9BACL